jgi:phage terminase small subunit
MASRKERVWLEEYFKCWNATEAARRANYAYPNKQGPAKLKKFADEISARIEELTMSADEALLRLSEIARGEWGQYVTEEGRIDIEALVEDGKGYLVKQIRETKHGKNIEFYDAQRALVDIAKAHGVFVERHEVTGKDGGAIAVRWPEEAED